MILFGYVEFDHKIKIYTYSNKLMSRVKTHLHNACGSDDIMGPYPCELSYNSNNGAATNL